MHEERAHERRLPADLGQVGVHEVECADTPLKKAARLLGLT